MDKVQAVFTAVVAWCKAHPEAAAVIGAFILGVFVDRVFL